MTLCTLQYNGVEKSLADWGIAAGSASREVNNQGGDTFACEVLAAADVAVDPFPFGAQIILRLGRTPAGILPANGAPPSGVVAWSGGKVFFVGWRLDNQRIATAQEERLKYKFGGPWDFFLNRLVFRKLFLTYSEALGQQIADYRSQVVLGQSLNTLTGPTDTIPGTIATNLMSISQQIREIVTFCINQTTAKYGSPQFQFDGLTQDGDGNWVLNSLPGPNCQIPDYVPGTGSGAGGNGLAPGQTTYPLLAPLNAVQDITCAEALRYETRWLGQMGSAVQWFDYTTTAEDGVTPLPTLKIATRDQMPSLNLSAFGSTVELQITRRDDLIPSAVDLMYRVATTGLTEVFHDIASATASTNVATEVTSTAALAAGIDFGAPAITLDFEGAVFAGGTTETVTIATLPSPGGSTTPADWAHFVPSLFHISSGTVTIDSLTDPDTGADVTTAYYTFSYVLTSAAGVASWMTSGATDGASLRVRVEGHYTGVRDSTGNVVANAPFFVELVMSNIPGGTYSQTTGGGLVAPSETIPFGLASYIYGIEKIPQYQGVYVLQEVEVSDAVPMGNNLCLTGSLAEWSTMNATIQQISYNLEKGTTKLTFGPAEHLGAKDLVERLRVNRFPRFYFLIGGNLLNE